MKEHITPEEKLLRLIRGQKSQQSAILPKQEISKDNKSGLTKPDAILVTKKAIASYFTHNSIQKILISAIAVSFVYLIASFVYPLVSLNKIKLPTITSEKIEEPQIQPKAGPKPYEFYMEGIKQHQIFGNPSSQEDGIPNVITNSDLIKGINLVGIISGDNPQAIIEDKKTQKTYYVNKGQFIGEFQLEDIQAGKVILNYNGQKFELYL